MNVQLSAAEKINASVSEILAGRYVDDRKVTITLAYLNLASDHLSAITLLFRSKLYGSGLALVRSVFEAMLRAHWIVGCATSEEVDQFAEDHDFDIMSRVDPDRIDRAFQAHGFFRTAKTDSWKALNAYTHGGLGQLIRQFHQGRIEASYTDEDILEGLRSATASVLLIGYLLAKLTQKQAEAAEIERLFERVP